MTNRAIFAMAAALLALTGLPGAVRAGQWDAGDLARLRHWVAMAPQDALEAPGTDALDRAEAAGDPVALAEAADALALRLARLHLLGGAMESERAGWRIEDTDTAIALEELLESSLAVDTLDAFFVSLRPRHPDYARLREALAAETDAARRRTLARNMERWRWMPRDLGRDYLLVNAALFEAQLWRGGAKAGTWRVIVGKTSTPTPVFAAEVTGVNLNPWWNVPASIVRESVGALVRNNPAAARARGYVWDGGRIRQKPGPSNALGQMKLVMPNPYSVFMHDTPNKELFARELRAFSHGCIRTGDAIGFAKTLLEGVKSGEEVDAILATNESTVVDIARPMPIYIAYFTAGVNGAGELVVADDIYGRDGRIRLASREPDYCAG